MNNCNSSCWWRCGIPSLEHISIEVQNEIFSKPMWFLEQDCDDNCYCSTNDNLGDSCNDGDIKYGECMHYTSWSTTEYHTCEDQKPPLTTCGDGCCDTYDGKKTCCNGKCVLSTKCCGDKILALDEECCDGKIIKTKCDRFIVNNEEFSTQADANCAGPCGEQRCGCDTDSGQICCEDNCVDEEQCCNGILLKDGFVCCNKKPCNMATHSCLSNGTCCRTDKIIQKNDGTKQCCSNREISCGGKCCVREDCKNTPQGPTCFTCPTKSGKKGTYQWDPQCNNAFCEYPGLIRCGCNAVYCNTKAGEKCFAAPELDTGVVCCGKGYKWYDGQCCSEHRAGKDGNGQPRCCKQGEKMCGDGKCRRVCKNCLDKGGSGIESCDPGETCCPGGGCYQQRGSKCCFAGTPLAHICPDNTFCCGSANCCEDDEVCCGNITNIANLKCLKRNEYVCCAFMACLITGPGHNPCCGRNCCTDRQICRNGICVDIPGA